MHSIKAIRENPNFFKKKIEERNTKLNIFLRFYQSFNQKRLDLIFKLHKEDNTNKEIV